MATFDYTYWLRVKSNKKVQDISPTNPRFPKLQKFLNLLGGLAARGGVLGIYPLASSSGATNASGTITFTGAQAHGSGASNAAFTFTAGSAGACTVTIGTVTGITITGSGTAATDASALVTAIQASAANLLVTATANSGDVRLVARKYGPVGNAIATVVTATGGGKLSAAGATLTGGTPAAGSLGNAVINGHTVALGSATSTQDVYAVAAAAAALINADAAASKLVSAAGKTTGNDAVVTLTALVPPVMAEVGNGITLTASVGTASGATLAGGVNATANESTF